ncbi:hypothetical protein B0H14DRAFT_2666053 [Mycena olivaceomarginata]|nr:hypothetical protein B0H14DRAFT_2666053 [Mycena olivaceomarginata]
MRPSRSPRPAPLSLSLAHQNASEYTLQSVDTDHTPLNTPTTPSYGSAIHHRPTLILGSILWLALPTLEEDDRPKLRIPKSFAQLQDLNGILKKYRDIFPYRIFICFVVTLFIVRKLGNFCGLQAFSLPGSMYMSILGGAVWGMPIALPLVCCLVASGATLCYLISDALGPALLTIPKWKAMLDKWARKIQQNQDNMISFLIVLRIAPLPPHWALNILAPHMTSSDDFHLISWRNFFGLSAVVVGVMIPVGLRYWFGKRGTVVNVEDEEEEEEGVETTAIPGEEDGEEEDLVLAVGPPVHELPKDSDDDESEDDLDDQDIVLEAGPAIALVPKDNQRA